MKRAKSFYRKRRQLMRRVEDGARAGMERAMDKVFQSIAEGLFPSAFLAKTKEENARLKTQVAVAKDVIQRGVDVMTKEQLGQWSGVRSFLEQETEDYEPSA
jgi:hypothetical protein